MIRNIKKRSISESGKADETSKPKLNKPMKKLKAENKNDAQNGQAVIQKKGNKKGQDKKQVQNVVKKEIKSPSKENNAVKKANQMETTDELKKVQSKLPAKKNELSIEQLKEKIKEMESRPSLSKTAKRKLTVFKKKLSISEAEQSGGEVSTKQTEGNKSLESTKKQEKTKPNKGNVKMDHSQGSFVIKKEEDDEEEEEEEQEEEEEEEEMEASEEEDDDDVDDEEDVDEDEEEEEDDEEDEDDDNDDEDEEDNAGKPLRKKQKGDESKNKKSTEQEKKKRYTLFVGNIPYSATEDDLKKHFLTKVSEVVCVRIPIKEETNEPRGFAYVEFSNNTDFEKAFSLHLSTLGGRRINVQFATRQKGGDKREGVAKNFKLHALRKAGKLAGSHKKNQRNSAMKGKQNAKPVQT